MKRTVVLLLAAFPFMCPLTARSESIWLTGAQVQSRGSYAYLGYLRPVSELVDGSGWMHRVWVDDVRYEYDKDGTEIRGLAPGASYGLGYLGRSGDTGYAFYGGIDARHTRLTPDDTGNDSRGTVVSPYLSAEAEVSLGAESRMQMGASYLPVTKAYWTRIRFTPPAGLPVAPEVVVQGDPSYKKTTLGLVSKPFRGPGQFNCVFRIGASRTGSEKTQAFIGLELTGSGR